MAKTRGTQRTLTPDRIVAEAIVLADRDGLDVLSMRGLATALGVTAMSLYNHVANKDALIDLMLDQVASEIASIDVNGPWQAMMRLRATSMRKVLLAHPWAAALLGSRIVMGAAILRDIDRSLGCLVNGGFSYAQADWARNAIDNHVYGFTLQEMNFPVAPEDYQEAAAHYLPEIDQTEYPFMYQSALHIIDGSYDGMLDFNFGLELVLSGLTRWIEDGAVITTDV